MTFILAIQLEYSIIVAADHHSAFVNDNGDFTYKDDQTNKIFTWNNGIIAGAGEVIVIERAIDFFIKEAESNITELPKYLKISRLLREQEVQHDQIKTTQLLYSNYCDTGAQIFTIHPNALEEYEVEKCKNNEIILWLFKPDISNITPILKNLYEHLKPYHFFESQAKWVNYYINYFSQIYRKQAKLDPLMSQSFHVFFQTKNTYIYGYIPNTHDVPLYFKKSDCI